MLRLSLASLVLAAAGFVASAQAAPLQEGRSTYLHHHHHAAHYYEMTHRHHHANHHHVGGDYGHRSTATGGNPGGYADRN